MIEAIVIGGMVLAAVFMAYRCLRKRPDDERHGQHPD